MCMLYRWLNIFRYSLINSLSQKQVEYITCWETRNMYWFLFISVWLITKLDYKLEWKHQHTFHQNLLCYATEGNSFIDNEIMRAADNHQYPHYHQHHQDKLSEWCKTEICNIVACFIHYAFFSWELHKKLFFI